MNSARGTSASSDSSGGGGDVVSLVSRVDVHASVSHANDCGVSAGKARAMCVSCSSLSGRGRNCVRRENSEGGRRWNLCRDAAEVDSLFGESLSRGRE